MSLSLCSLWEPHLPREGLSCRPKAENPTVFNLWNWEADKRGIWTPMISLRAVVLEIFGAIYSTEPFCVLKCSSRLTVRARRAKKMRRSAEMLITILTSTTFLCFVFFFFFFWINQPAHKNLVWICPIESYNKMSWNYIERQEISIQIWQSEWSMINNIVEFTVLFASR